MLLSWITTNKNAKEYIKNTVPNALIDKKSTCKPRKKQNNTQ